MKMQECKANPLAGDKNGNQSAMKEIVNEQYNGCARAFQVLVYFVARKTTTFNDQVLGL